MQLSLSGCVPSKAFDQIDSFLIGLVMTRVCLFSASSSKLHVCIANPGFGV